MSFLINKNNKLVKKHKIFKLSNRSAWGKSGKGLGSDFAFLKFFKNAYNKFLNKKSSDIQKGVTSNNENISTQNKSRLPIHPMVPVSNKIGNINFTEKEVIKFEACFNQMDQTQKDYLFEFLADLQKQTIGTGTSIAFQLTHSKNVVGRRVEYLMKDPRDGRSQYFLENPFLNLTSRLNITKPAIARVDDIAHSFNSDNRYVNTLLMPKNEYHYSLKKSQNNILKENDIFKYMYESSKKFTPEELCYFHNLVYGDEHLTWGFSNNLFKQKDWLSKLMKGKRCLVVKNKYEEYFVITSEDYSFLSKRGLFYQKNGFETMIIEGSPKIKGKFSSFQSEVEGNEDLASALIYIKCISYVSNNYNKNYKLLTERITNLENDNPKKKEFGFLWKADDILR